MNGSAWTEVRSKALVFLVESHALRRDREGMEHYAALALAAASGDPVAEAFVWGAGRAMLALLEDDQAGALRAFDRSAVDIAGLPACRAGQLPWDLATRARGHRR